jgi:CubicO group peptidase (beta-lactamase class C family)
MLAPLIARSASAVCLAALLGACGGGTSPSGTPDQESLVRPRYFPSLTGDEWATVAPAAVGWDGAALDSALAYAGTRSTTALIVLHRGRIVAERYWRGWTPSTSAQIASAGKSVAAALVGGLQERGRLRLADTVSNVIGAGWSRATPDQERAVTVRHLLTMSSGLDDRLQYVAPAGRRFFYNNSAYFTLFAVLERAAGRPVNDVMREQLSSRIGLRSAEWRPAVEADGTPGFRLWMSARDMARFGLLVAAGGQWAGEPILRDTAFLAAMLSSQAADNPAYGYLWWLNGQSAYRLPGPMTLPTFDGPLLPDAPRDLVSALGRGDKKIYVSRALDVVVVRHGADASDDVLPLGPSSFDAELWRRLRPAMRY